MVTTQIGRERTSSIGSRVRDGRKKCGLTQKEFAAKAGVHHNAISGLESAKTKNPMRETLDKIAGVLGITVNDLEGYAATAAPSLPNTGLTFLDEFRLKYPETFADWPEVWKAVMWSRFTEICSKMGITTDYGAQFFVEAVTKEFVYVRQLLDLCDWNRADNVTSLISVEHARSNLTRGETFTPRIDPSHQIPQPHNTTAYSG